MNKLLNNNSNPKADWMFMEKLIPPETFSLSSTGSNSEFHGVFGLNSERSQNSCSEDARRDGTVLAQPTATTDTSIRTVLNDPPLHAVKVLDQPSLSSHSVTYSVEATSTCVSSMMESASETLINSVPSGSFLDSSSCDPPVQSRVRASEYDSQVSEEHIQVVVSAVPSSSSPSHLVTGDRTEANQDSFTSYTYQIEPLYTNDSSNEKVNETREAMYLDNHTVTADQTSATQPTAPISDSPSFSHTSGFSCSVPLEQINLIVSPPLTKDRPSNGTQTSSSPAQVHICNLCGKRYRHSTSLKNHMRKHESGVLASKRYRCNFCVYSSQYKRNVHKHIDSTHRSSDCFTHINIDPHSQTQNVFEARERLSEGRNSEQWIPQSGDQQFLYDALKSGLPVSRIPGEDQCTNNRMNYGTVQNINVGWKQMARAGVADTALGTIPVSSPMCPGSKQPHSEKRKNSIGSPMSYSSPQKPNRCEVQGCGKTFKTSKSRTLHMVSCHRDFCFKLGSDGLQASTQLPSSSVCGFPCDRRNSLQELLSPDGTNLSSQRRISLNSNRTSPGSILSEFCPTIDHPNPAHTVKRPFSGPNLGATADSCSTPNSSSQFLYSSDGSKSAYTDVYSFTDNGPPPESSGGHSEYSSSTRSGELGSATRTPFVDPPVVCGSADFYTEERLSRHADFGSTPRIPQELPNNCSVSPEFNYRVYPMTSNAVSPVPEGNVGYASEGYRQSDFSLALNHGKSTPGHTNTFGYGKIPRTTVEQLLCAPDTSSSALHAYLTQNTSGQLDNCDGNNKRATTDSINFGANSSQSFEDIGTAEETTTTPYYCGTPEADSDSLALGHVNSETDAFFTDLEEILAREVPLFDTSNSVQRMDWNANDPCSSVPQEPGCKSGESSSTTKSPISTTNPKPTASLMSGDSGLESWSSSSSCSAGPNSAPIWGSQEMGVHSKLSPPATTPQSSYPTPTSDHVSNYGRCTTARQSNLEEPYSLGSHIVPAPCSHRLTENPFSPTVDDEQSCVGNLKNSVPPMSASQHSEMTNLYPTSKTPLLRDCDSNYAQATRVESSFLQTYGNSPIGCHAGEPSSDTGRDQSSYLDRHAGEDYPNRPTPVSHGTCFPKQDDLSSFRTEPMQVISNPVQYDSAEFTPGFRHKTPFYGLNERHGMIQHYNHPFKASIPYGSQDPHLYRLTNHLHSHREASNFAIASPHGRAMMQQPVSSYSGGPYTVSELSMHDTNSQLPQPHSDPFQSGQIHRELKGGMSSYSETVQFNPHHQSHSNSGYLMSNQATTHPLLPDAAMHERMGHSSQSLTAAKGAWMSNQSGASYHTGYQQQQQTYKAYCGPQVYEGAPHQAGPIGYPNEQFQHFSYGRPSNQEAQMLSQPYRTSQHPSISMNQVYQQQQLYSGTYHTHAQHPVPQPAKSFSSHAHIQRHPGLPIGTYPVHVDYASGRRPTDAPIAPQNEVYHPVTVELSGSWVGSERGSATFASQSAGYHVPESDGPSESSSATIGSVSRFDHHTQQEQPSHLIGPDHNQHVLSNQQHGVRDVNESLGNPAAPSMNNSVGPNSTVFVYRPTGTSLCPPGLPAPQQAGWPTSQPTETPDNTVSILTSQPNLV
ncbi:hypothetical protein CRM22_011261 [Opisthorchis felineus]|uniref:C2H2-type domain-containing protein n=1 Tax=Opisthorchis felineus TaxID=147828 RepID=A0A4S2JTL0_OPIFE|nr:hypothetical protein CRM22_011261 [Opisthorchis felineus]TGZ39815.1 hypothetical protein CRM22_011261 [Opisthorchis felineus]TGZ39816.1 hypothetical protein CRM22_011261 [Opisthorchis felineus]